MLVDSLPASHQSCRFCNIGEALCHAVGITYDVLVHQNHTGIEYGVGILVLIVAAELIVDITEIFCLIIAAAMRVDLL